MSWENNAAHLPIRKMTLNNCAVKQVKQKDSLKRNNYYEKLIWKGWRRFTVALSDVRQGKEKPRPVREWKSCETPLALAVTFKAASWPQREFKQSLIELMWHMTEAVEAEAYAILWLKLVEELYTCR